MQNQRVRKRAEKIFREMKPSCDRGGCKNHSSKEPCALDVAWDRAVSQAGEELIDFRLEPTSSESA